jgi:hypothetical protein
MTQELHLWVEGRTDASENTSGDDERRAEYGGALMPILRKTLTDLSGLRAENAEPELRIRVHGLRERLRKVVGFQRTSRAVPSLSGFARKLAIAFVNAKAKDGQDLIVAVRDCDGYRERISERDQINGHFRDRSQAGLAMGLCIEMVEAWLLPDGAAFAKCFGKGPDKGPSGNPESIRDPKEELLDILGRYEGVSSRRRSEVYGQLAEHVDLDQLAKNCPDGYRRFRDDLRELIVPAMR